MMDENVPNRIYDEKILYEIVKQALNENPWMIIEYKQGKERVFFSLIAAAMKKTDGKGDPDTIERILRRLIK